MTIYNIDETEGLDSGEYQELLAALGKSHEDKQRSVLVVDDEPSVRRMVSRSMRSLDPSLKVHEAENGLEALSVLEIIRREEGSDPILIVTDLQMPVMDGWEFIEKLWQECQAHKRNCGIPVVVLSSSSGVKGRVFTKSVHGDKNRYRPLITIAKENCTKPMKYDGQGAQGLVAWLQYFVSGTE